MPDTFSGLLQSTVTCLRCGNVTTTCDPMLDISLGLRAEKRKKLATQPTKSGGKGEDKQNELVSPIGRRLKQGNTLTDCLDRYTCPEKLGPNDYSCSKCGNTFQEATKQLSVKRLPPVLSFQLKRFEHGGSASKIESKIKFPVDLDMTPYTTKGRTSKRTEENLYTLFAVINHQGRMDTGHYTMFAKHRGEWFKFDDHSVTMAYQKDVLDSKANPIAFLQRCQQTYGDIFTFYMLGKRVTACLGPDGNQFVFNAKQNIASAAAAYNHMTKPVFGDDVVFDCPHSVFMEQKRFIKAGLNIENFRRQVPLIVEETEAYFSKLPSSGTIDYHTMGQVIIYTASRTLLGKEIRDALDDGVARLYYDLDLGFSPINFMFPNLPLPVNRRRDAARQKIFEVYSSIIQRRRRDNDYENHDLLQALMDASYKDGSPVPDHHIAGILTAALFGGQHTSATTITWTLLELAAQPDVVQALRQEQIDVLGSLKAPLTYDNLEKLVFLEDVVRETLRVHPPIFQMMRKVVSPTVFAKTGHEIPVGDYLAAVPGVTQCDPAYFNEPTTWNPRRWSIKTDPVHQLEVGEDAKMDYGFGAVGISSRSPFLPFGAGRHRCIGEKFGYLQLKTVVATILRQIDLQPRSVPEPDFTSMVVVPKHSEIKYTKRH
ncbi:Lanosterol 14-alpha-demethylase [Apophysomyces ossiformis]|uniref:Lanosterol 14-alpha-demethylase n=1 Tax=Apophysomyces ossiformis TaxID=679940 RepID=A0A8H7BNI2_9FUNG|nr:Lanosterol 14-alpha-demethylase [Apophysomyces ossiformis]